MTLSIQNFYQIIKVERPSIKGIPYAKIALFEEEGYLGSILENISEVKIIKFIEKVKTLKIYTGNTSSINLEEFKRQSFVDEYTAMIVLTDEKGFQSWRTFMEEKFKSHEREFAVLFCRR